MIRITLKGTPPSLNTFLGKMDGREYQEAKRIWTQHAFFMARTCKDRPAEPYELADVEIMYYFRTRGRRDPDNFCGKLFMDGLVKAKIIKDDSMDHVRLHIAGGYDKNNPRTVITVKETENG